MTLDYESFRFNRAIARIREFTNIIFEDEEALKIAIKKDSKLFKNLIEKVLKILSPIVPHIAEEIWNLLGNKNFIIESSWPIVDKEFLKIENITLAVQVNGKLKETLNLPVNLEDSDVEKKILELPKIKNIIGSNKPKKIIIVKNRVANIVI